MLWRTAPNGVEGLEARARRLAATGEPMAFYSDNQTTRVRPGGLRYESKAAGTSFAGTACSSMSCLLCGQHRPRALLRVFKLAGAPQYRCRDGCCPS